MRMMKDEKKLDHESSSAAFIYTMHSSSSLSRATSYDAERQVMSSAVVLSLSLALVNKINDISHF